MTHLFEQDRELTVFCTFTFTQSAGGPISITVVSNLAPTQINKGKQVSG